MARLAACFAPLSALILVCGCAASKEPTISLVENSPRVLAIRGLDARLLDGFEGLEQAQRDAAFQVRVGNAPPDAPLVLGETSRHGDELAFIPRYPFLPGVQYRAQFDPSALGGGHGTVLSEFTIPAPPSAPVTRVAAIYPSSDELPENLLKFYIHFSGPMSRGEAYRRIQLLDESGKPVDVPFLELPEELWNPEMTRFTLFFEPGRVKEGLVPRLEMGAPLAEGKTYTLVIDAAWQDSEGRPLIEPAKKTFRTVPADHRQPDPARWRITRPPAGTIEDLIIVFDEPLDHAVLGRALTVQREGKQLTGKVNISEQERAWSFTPAAPWEIGKYVVAVKTILEDTAGNSIGRPFEVDLNRSSGLAGPEIVEIPFDVSR